METDIYTKIEQYSDMEFHIGIINQDKQKAIDSVLTPEIKQQLADIEAEFGEQVETLQTRMSALADEIKAEVAQFGRTIKGNHHQFVWSKPRVSWDTKALDGYATAHPEILQFRKEGNPSVSVRKV